MPINISQRTFQEKENKDFQKISFWEYLYLFVLIIYAGQASVFVRAQWFSENLLGYSIPIILSIIFFFKWRLKINKRFLLLLLFLFFYFAAVTIKYKELHPTIFLYYVFIFFIVYVTISGLQFDFFEAYENILFYLCLIALGFWGIQTILGGDTLYNYFEKIPGLDKFSYVSGTGGFNVIAYSIQYSETAFVYGISIPRNCGFAWEPGGFGVYICLAVLIKLFFSDPDQKFNFHFWVFLAALVSTQSTTGYTIFIALIFFYYINRKSNAMVLIIPLLVIAIIFAFSLPFMSNKIIKLIEETKNVDYIVWKSIGNPVGSAPQRFSSFFIAFRDFYQNPVLGTGGIAGASWYNKIGANISPISGLGNLMGTFGTIGTLFFGIISYKTSIFLSNEFNYKSKALIFVIILLISISYSIIFLPLVMCFWMFAFFATPPDNNEIGIES